MRILIVTWGWPPVGGIGAMRPLGLAREWTTAGHEVHVLTGPGDRGAAYAPNLLPTAEATGARVHRASAPGVPVPKGLVPFYAADAARCVTPPRPISRLRQVLGQWRGFPDLQRSWIRPASHLARQLHSVVPFDVVWSTSPPESAHFVARSVAGLGVPWVADFRDHWSDYVLGRWDPVSRWAVDRITGAVLRRASRVTANTEGVAASISRAAGRDVVCVRNGYDAIVSPNLPVRQRVLGYFGRIDATSQHPERLWEPLRTCQVAGRPWRVELRTSPPPPEGTRVTVPEDLREWVQALPPLPHAEALTSMSTMAALLILGWEMRAGEGAVGGKLFEYIGSGRPVLVLAPAHYEVRRLVESRQLGIGAFAPEEISAALDRLAAFEPRPEGRADLSRAAAAAQFAAIFESARADPARR